jgi:hypothetical protein
MLSSLLHVNRISFTVNRGFSKPRFPLSGTSWNMYQPHSLTLHRSSLPRVFCPCFPLKRSVTLSMGSRGFLAVKSFAWFQTDQLQDQQTFGYMQYYFKCSCLWPDTFLLQGSLYRVSTMKLPGFITFPGSKESYGYGLIVDKCQSHNTPSLILKISTFLHQQS